MPALIFKKKYIDLIKSGKKTQTIRLWNKSRNIKVGDIFTATDFKSKIPIKITKIYYKEVNLITKEEAILDGFLSKDELYNAIIECYGTLNKVATIIRFSQRI